LGQKNIQFFLDKKFNKIGSKCYKEGKKYMLVLHIPISLRFYHRPSKFFNYKFIPVFIFQIKTIEFSKLYKKY